MYRLVTTFTLAFILLFSIVAEAKVTIEVLNPNEGKYQVTYELKVTKAHSTEYNFPRNGFLSRDRKIKVVSVKEKNTDQELKYEVVPAKDKNGETVDGRYVVKTKFVNPIPEGGNYILVYKVILYNKDDCYIDSDGRWLFQYSTGHDAFFILPEGHAVVYANYPVLVYEKASRTVLQQKPMTDDNDDYSYRKLIFKTREFKK
mgnify:FL=1